MPEVGANAARAHAAMSAMIATSAQRGLTAGRVRAIDYGEQVTFSDGAAAVTVNVYGGKAGVRIVQEGRKDTNVYGAVAGLIASVQGGASASTSAGRPSSSTQRPTPSDRTSQHSAKSPPPVDGQTTASLPALKPARSRSSRFPPPPWIGSDESGKGDYFGPLVAAAVYVGPGEETELRKAGVRDSKLLDDMDARRIAASVRRLCAGRFAEDVLAPASYNRLYAEFRGAGENLNHLLAWSHVHALDALLTAGSLPAESPPTVIADQFADERFVRERLALTVAQRGLPMPVLIQQPRAEANVAVAAASILARDRFLDWLQQAGVRYGIELPKGGSKPSIIAAARLMLRRHGDSSLADVAKLHFATTKLVRGTLT